MLGTPVTTQGVKTQSAAPYRVREGGAVGDTAGFLAAANRVGQRQANTQRNQGLQQYENAYNYFGNVAGFDPMTGTTADTQEYLGRLGVDASGNPTGGGQLGMTLGNRDYMGRLLGEDYGTNLKRLGLQEQETQQDKAGLNRRVGKGGYFDQLGGLVDRSLLNQLAGYDVQETSARNAHQTARRGEISDATSRGSLQTHGTREDLGDIAKNLWQNVLGLNVQREGANIGADKERTSLAEQRAQDKDRLGALDLKAKDYGLQRDQFKTDLDRGLQKLGIDAYFSTNDIIDKANSAKAEDRKVADQIIRNAMDYSDQFPGTGSATQGSTYNRPRGH